MVCVSVGVSFDFFESADALESPAPLKLLFKGAVPFLMALALALFCLEVRLAGERSTESLRIRLLLIAPSPDLGVANESCFPQTFPRLIWASAGEAGPTVPFPKRPVVVLEAFPQPMNGAVLLA